MNFITKLKFSILQIFFIFLLTSCPLGVHEQEFGKEISNYPEWCSDNTESKYCFGYSKWFDWQSEQGKNLHYLLNDTISNDFAGKVRIEIRGQNISFYFSKEDFAQCSLYCFYGNATNIDFDCEVPQENPNKEFKYNCKLKKVKGYKLKTFLEQESANVTLTKISDSAFNLKLLLNEQEIINVDMKNKNTKVSCIDNENLPYWLPNSIYVDNIGDSNFSDSEIYFSRELFYANSTLNSSDYVYLNFYNFLACFEGISLRAIDGANRKISFYLMDKNESDFADYFEIIVEKSFTENEAKSGNIYGKNLGSLGFYKENEEMTKNICFYDKSKCTMYFSGEIKKY